VFSAATYGMPTLGLTYVTTKDYAAQHPEVVERFLKAVLHGIEWARDNRDEAVDIVLKYATGEDREHQRFMLDTELAAAESDVTRENGLGWQTAEQWQALSASLRQFGALSKPVDANAAFSDEYLSAIYKDGQLQWP